MSILNPSSRWPLYLAVAGLVILIATLWYTNSLADRLGAIEEGNRELLEIAAERLTTNLNVDPSDSTALYDDLTMETEVLGRIVTVPRILTNQMGGVDDAFGYGDRDSVQLLEDVRRMIEEGRQPTRLYDQMLYFDESVLQEELRYFPLVLFGLLALFVTLGFVGLYQTQKAEQNRVWVGMSKETAHQLGTPISAIIGWVEHLKLMYADDEDIIEVADELNKDVGRLSMVANRFSKIGAKPELEPTNVYEELERCKAYMEKRAPRKIKFDFPTTGVGNAKVAINPLLFDWVVENLLRNALDAMDGKGTISGAIRETDDKIMIDITDTGKGIAAGDIRKVFRPGFTTKKRGWGLGLSLVRRIVHEYHKGKIVVARSEPGVGTTFTITLPRVD